MIKNRAFNCIAVNKQFIRSALLKTSSASETAETTHPLKSWEEVPGPPALPIIGPILQILLQGKLEDYKGYKLYDTMYKRYGPIVKIKRYFGASDVVMLFDPEAIEYGLTKYFVGGLELKPDYGNRYKMWEEYIPSLDKGLYLVLRSENSLPIRPGFESLAYYRHQKVKKTSTQDDSNRLTGLISDHGENWKIFRSTVNQIMLQPKTIKLYTDELEKVADDMIGRMRSLRDENNMITKKLDMEMNLWALESIGVIALGTRLNCFEPNLPEDSPARKLIRNIHELFKIPEKLDFGPSPWRYVWTPALRKATKLYEEQESLTKHFIDKALKIMEESKKNSNETDLEKPVLEKLLEVDVGIAHMMASDMLIAGVDTASNTALITLYLLATNPEKQKNLREEVLSKQTKKPYLKACIKESMRMLPVAGVNARFSTKEYNLLGYQIPKGVLMSFPHQYMSNMEEHYPKPREFIPERWLTDKNDPMYQGNTHAFVTSPFGYGVRMCIGRRIAELEMETFIAKVMENFEVDWKGEPMRIVATSLNNMTEPFNFVFKDLKTND